MVEKSNIYTKGGDKGQTSLLGGRRVPKFDQRIEAYGTIDELMAHTALLRDMTVDDRSVEELLFILDRLMSAASVVAAEGDNLPDNMPEIVDKDITYLEGCIDVMDDSLPKLKSFILPGGDKASSQAHVARTVCRRAERNVIKLASSEDVNEKIIKFLNRLSDYYFLLSRKLSYLSGAKEMPWKP